MKDISRREFGALLAAGVVTGSFAPSIAHARPEAERVTAGEVIDRIVRNLGVPWDSDTVDTIKAGDPTSVVTGIATTSATSLEVLRAAVEAGANLIITAGPAFYGRADGRTPPAARGPGAQAPMQTGPDPVYAAKNELVDRNGLVIFRLSDHWRRRRPDGFVQGLAETVLGRGAFPAANDPFRYDMPATTLDSFASDVKRRLGSRGGVRVIGDPRTRVRRIGLLPGNTPITASLQTLPAADVVIAGEVREWESAEYARDVVFAGQPKGLILVGRTVSEEPGMRLCAHWLGPLVPEVAVHHIGAGDPYWRPGS